MIVLNADASFIMGHEARYCEGLICYNSISFIHKLFFNDYEIQLFCNLIKIIRSSVRNK